MEAVGTKKPEHVDRYKVSIPLIPPHAALPVQPSLGQGQMWSSSIGPLRRVPPSTTCCAHWCVCNVGID